VLGESQVQHWEKRLVRNWQYRSGPEPAKDRLVLASLTGSALERN
jgi:hypothetical protein